MAPRERITLRSRVLSGKRGPNVLFMQCGTYTHAAHVSVFSAEHKKKKAAICMFTYFRSDTSQPRKFSTVEVKMKLENAVKRPARPAENGKGVEKGKMQ